MSVTARTRRFSVEEYHRMVRAGILREDDRVELIDGEIVEMTPISPRHAICVDRLTQLLVASLGGRATARVQGPVRLGPHSEPQPDLALLHPPLSRYAECHPGPGDVVLVIEVAETSADDDRTRKMLLYSRAGVREAWLVDLPGQRVEVYRVAAMDGYQDVRVLGRGQSAAPEVFADIRLAVGDILG